MTKRLWLLLTIVVVAGLLTAAGLLMRDAGVGEGGGAATDTEASEPGVSPGSGSSEASSAGSSAEESIAVISDAPAQPGDNVSNEIAYELIDALKASGIEPVPGEALTLAYVERLNRVRVSGKFESDEATSYVLVFENSVWKVER